MIVISTKDKMINYLNEGGEIAFDTIAIRKTNLKVADMSTKYTHRVFFRQLTDKQRDQLNAEGWGSEIGRAYMDSDCFGDREPKYEGAIKLQLFEMATQLQTDEGLDFVWSAIQNYDTPWALRYPKFTFFPRSMATGDIIYDRLADKFFIVAGIGFRELTDEAMINHLKGM